MYFFGKVPPAAPAAIAAALCTGFASVFGASEERARRETTLAVLALLKALAEARALGKAMAEDASLIDAMAVNLEQALALSSPSSAQGSPPPPVVAEPSPKTEGEQGVEIWNCSVCTFTNETPAKASTFACEMCATPHTRPKPVAKAPPPPPQRAVSSSSSVDSPEVTAARAWGTSLLADALALSACLVPHRTFLDRLIANRPGSSGGVGGGGGGGGGGVSSARSSRSLLQVLVSGVECLPGLSAANAVAAARIATAFARRCEDAKEARARGDASGGEGREDEAPPAGVRVVATALDVLAAPGQPLPAQVALPSLNLFFSHPCVLYSIICLHTQTHTEKPSVVNYPPTSKS